MKNYKKQQFILNTKTQISQLKELIAWNELGKALAENPMLSNTQRLEMLEMTSIGNPFKSRKRKA